MIKLLILISFITLCSCVKKLEPYINKSNCEEKTIIEKEYIVLNPLLVGKCFKRHERFFRVIKLENNGYTIHKFTKGCFNNICRLVSVYYDTYTFFTEINKVNNGHFVKCPKTLKEIDNE